MNQQLAAVRPSSHEDQTSILPTLHDNLALPLASPPATAPENADQVGELFGGTHSCRPKPSIQKMSAGVPASSQFVLRLLLRDYGSSLQIKICLLCKYHTLQLLGNFLSVKKVLYCRKCSRVRKSSRATP